MEPIRGHMQRTNEVLASVRASGGGRIESTQRAMVSSMKLQLRAMHPSTMTENSAELLLLLNESQFDSALKDELCELVRVTDDVVVGNKQQKVCGLDNYTMGFRHAGPLRLIICAAARDGGFVKGTCTVLQHTLVYQDADVTPHPGVLKHSPFDAHICPGSVIMITHGIRCGFWLTALAHHGVG